MHTKVTYEVYRNITIYNITWTDDKTYEELLEYRKEIALSLGIRSEELEVKKICDNEIEIKDLEISQNKISLIQEVLENKKQDEEVCILVRRNSDVDNIKELCDENKIPCEVSSTGDFFRCEAVRELYIMIKS